MNQIISEFNIIDATNEDIDFIYKSLLNMVIEEKVEDRFTISKSALEGKFFLLKLANCFIARSNQTPIGLCIYSQTNRNFTLFESAGLYIHDLFVLPEYRRKNVSTQIIEYLKEIAQKQDLGRIDFVVLKQNSDALKFYSKLPNCKIVDYIHYMRINLI